MNVVILCGGVGSRLWPLGRKNNPKQFFPVISNKPLLVETYDRFVATYGKKHLFFSVTRELLPHVRRLFPRIPLAQFIVEPARRDTAAAMGYAALTMSRVAPDEPLLFVPADHFIANKHMFLRCLKVAEELVIKTGKMADIGIAATYPSTVLGYTKIGDVFAKKHGVTVYHFKGHTEKPDSRTAIKYIASGKYLWHGSYYMWTPAKFLNAMARYAPQHFAVLEKIRPLLQGKNTKQIATLYDQMEKTSFDYVVTEKINKHDVLILKGEFGWSDVGAWDVLHNQLATKSDAKANVTKGPVISIDTKQSLIFGQAKKLTATVGLENMIVVDTPDALLVCPKDRAQEVKKLFPEIEKRGLTHYL